jgi:serine/threonine protein kinase
MKRLEHDNILPFYGVSTTISDFSLVFPWYKNGHVDRYLEENPDADRYDLVGTSKPTVHTQRSRESREQVLGVVKGLLFLHSNGVAHGSVQLVRDALLQLITFNAVNRVTY